MATTAAASDSLMTTRPPSCPTPYDYHCTTITSDSSTTTTTITSDSPTTTTTVASDSPAATAVAMT